MGKVRDNDTLILKKIIDTVKPCFNEKNLILARSKEINKACEEYSKYAISKINLPEIVVAPYDKLIKAILNIPKVSLIDKDKILSKYPELQIQFNTLDHYLQNYSRVLSGEMHYIDVLFPKGMEFSEDSYFSPESDYFNEIIARMVHNYLSETKDKMRIIEVGAGTGTCTRLTLPKLEEMDFEYYFTDIGSAFLKRAERIFSNYHHQITYKHYNVELDPPESFGKFDVVLGVNVLHATKDILNTLKNVRSLLNDHGGVLILHEVISSSLFATLTMGLTHGWWAYEDRWRIPDSPLISLENWHQLLRVSGFTMIESLATSDRAIIVAM